VKVTDVASRPRPATNAGTQPAALYATAHWLLRQGRPGDAAALVRAMVQMAPREELGWLMLGVCHEAAQQPALALEMYGVGRLLAAPAPRCELARARALRSTGRLDESIDAYASAADAAESTGDDELARLIERERRLQ
jgi:tetratricopeptide (TPR) repeat protein